MLTPFCKSLAWSLGSSDQKVAHFVALTGPFRSDISSPRAAGFKSPDDSGFGFVTAHQIRLTTHQ